LCHPESGIIGYIGINLIKFRQSKGLDVWLGNTPPELSDWFRIGAIFQESFPGYGRIWNYLCEKCGFLPDDHVLGELRQLFRSIMIVGQHAVYSSICIRRYSRIEASNTYEDYVQYYLYDHISRVKTSFDLYALMINHIYELRIEEPKCLLERGPLINLLDFDDVNKDLSSVINRDRNDWLISFYDMRNLIIHRSSLRFVIGSVSTDSLINIQLGEMLRVPKEREIVERFLTGICLDVPDLCMLDPVVLCDALWDRWKSLGNSILSSIEGRVYDYIQANL